MFKVLLTTKYFGRIGKECLWSVNPGTVLKP